MYSGEICRQGANWKRRSSDCPPHWQWEVRHWRFARRRLIGLSPRNGRGTCFEKWFTQQLPSNDDDNSVIVMSNAAYHSVPLEKLPSSSTLTISSCGSTTRASRSLPTIWNLNFWRLCLGVRRFSSYRVDTTANPQGVMLSAFQPTTAKLIPLRWSGVRLKDSLL